MGMFDGVLLASDYDGTLRGNTLRVLEREYQVTFEKKLTLKRLGEVISSPRRPDIGQGVRYDENLAPSLYVENDIERLLRLRLGQHGYHGQNGRKE